MPKPRKCIASYYECVARVMFRMHERKPVGFVERTLAALVEKNGDTFTSYDSTLAALKKQYPNEDRLRSDIHTLEGMARRSHLVPDSFALIKCSRRRR